MFEFDHLDRKPTASISGHQFRNDLMRQSRGQFPMPTSVVEFMLGRDRARAGSETSE
jgi:ATP-dependent Lon protease